MTERVKLTKPQRELLEEIVAWPRPCALEYKPAAKLMELGFAEARGGRFGAPTLHSTPAGRAYLAEDGA